MAAVTRRSLEALRSTQVTLATADDLNGTQDGSQWYDVTGAKKIVITQENSGTNGTAGVDVIEYSRDQGVTWSAVPDLLPVSQNDVTGTVVDNAILNVAGTEPTRYAQWTCGPYDGPVAIRCTRLVTDNANSAAWVTGAPAVYAYAIGGSHDGGALSTTLR